MKNICFFEGCDNYVHGLGLCHGHWSQVRKGNPLKPLYSQRDRICDFPGCENPHDSNGLCRGHASQRARGNPLTPITPKNRVCSFKGCNRKYEARGLCAGHYQQMSKGNPLIPIYSQRNKRGTGRDPERKKLSRRTASRRRQERKANAKGTCTPVQLEARIEYYGYHCAYCSGPFEAIDHVIPLSRGGTAWPANLVPACGSCNSSKCNKSIWEWLSILEKEKVA